METSFARFPAAEQTHLGNRLRSDDKRCFHAAFFELCLHEILLRTGHRVEVPPDKAGQKRPDFLAVQPDEGSVVLEASDATEVSSTEHGTSKILAKLEDEINDVDNPRFTLEVTMEASLTGGIPIAKLIGSIEEWIGQAPVAGLPEPLRLPSNGTVFTIGAFQEKPRGR